MKTIFSLTLCLLLTGCSLQVTVIDGDCNPVENAKIYYEKTYELSKSKQIKNIIDNL